MPNVKTAHGKFCRGLSATLLSRANLQNASHFVGVAYPPNKISKTGLKMQAFSACFMKFCLALNSNQVTIVTRWQFQARWHATRRPSTTRSAGSSVLHFSDAYGHLVWKRQPFGGLIGLGISPSSSVFSSPLKCGSAIGIAFIRNFVYGCSGFS